MDCTFENLSIVGVNATDIRASGRLDPTTQPCPSLQVAIEFPNGRRSTTAVFSGSAWHADFLGFAISDLKDWCDPRTSTPPFGVELECLSDNNDTLCKYTTKLPLTCCAAPPVSEAFFTVRDDQGRTVANPDKDCVSGDFVTVLAARGPVTWSATAGSRVIALTPIDGLTVRATLPIDGSPVTITATLTDGDCVYPIPISAHRCPPPPPPCVEVPPDYALVVYEAEGWQVAVGTCVKGAVARVIAPQHEGPVLWTVDGAPGVAEAGNPRAILVSLNDTALHTVTARVGQDKCARDVTRSLSRCEKPMPPKPGWLSECMLLLISGLGLLLGGSFLFTIGAAVLLFFVCLAEAQLVGVIVLLVFLVVAELGLIAMVIGTILLLIWFFACSGCDGLTSPFSSCEMLRFLHWVLLWIGIPLGILESLILSGAGSGSSICGVPLAGLLNLIPMLLDWGAIGFISLLVHWYGNSIGCFNSWPYIIPLWRLRDPLTLGAPCADKKP